MEGWRLHIEEGRKKPKHKVHPAVHTGGARTPPTRTLQVQAADASQQHAAVRSVPDTVSCVQAGAPDEASTGLARKPRALPPWRCLRR